jgi:hypothetical protein
VEQLVIIFWTSSIVLVLIKQNVSEGGFISVSSDQD